MKNWIIFASGGKKYIFSFIIIACLFLSLPASIMAQDNDMYDNLVILGDNSGLPNAELEVVVAKLINAAMTLAGLFLVAIFLYGGLVWMLALGDEIKVQKAKDSMIQGVIGLVIIVMSYSIANYLITILNAATNG